MSSNFRIDLSNDRAKFLVQVPFKMNNIVRRFPSRRFKKSKGVWEAPTVTRNMNFINGQLRQMNWVEFGPGVLDFIDQKLMELKDSRTLRPVNRNYPFKTEPFPCQMAAYENVYGLKAFALFMEMGTGKSKVVTDLTSMYYDAGDINALLVICPVAVKPVWPRELMRHGRWPEQCIQVCDIDTAGRERAVDEFITNTDLPFKAFIVGVESMSQALREGRAFEKAMKFLTLHNAYMAIDESHLIKNPDSNRTRNCISLGKAAKIRSIDTGTAISHGPLDLFAQFEFLDPNIIGLGDFMSFRNRYAIMGGYENKEIIGYDNMPELMALIKPYVYQCTLEDAGIDLPFVNEPRYIKLSKEQIKIYNDLKKSKIAEIAHLKDVEVIAKNILVLKMLQHQICGGFISYEDPEGGRNATPVIPIRKNPKIQDLMQVASDYGDKKIIIWAVYKRELAAIAEVLREKFGDGSVVEFHGGISPDGRKASDIEFREGAARFMVSNPQTGGVGQTWNESAFVYNYSKSFKFIDFEQSQRRNRRIGQDKPVVYQNAIAEGVQPQSVDQDVEDSLGMKMGMAEYVKRAIRESTGDWESLM